MITIIKTKGKVVRQGKNQTLVEIRGLSTDEKPKTFYGDTVDNGSIFIEIDTGKMYMYDLEHEQWKEV